MPLWRRKKASNVLYLLLTLWPLGTGRESSFVTCFQCFEGGSCDDCNDFNISNDNDGVLIRPCSHCDLTCCYDCGGKQCEGWGARQYQIVDTDDTRCFTKIRS